MRKAWEDALKKNADFYLWLNDDTVLYPSALVHLLEASRQMEHLAVICGSTCGPGTDEWTYGGMSGGKPVIPDGTLQECALCHGNILWVPRHVVDRIGILDGFYLHALGITIIPGRRIPAEYRCGLPHLSSEPVHGMTRPFLDGPGGSLIRRLRNLYSPLGNAQPRYYFHYVRKHEGCRRVRPWCACMYEFFPRLMDKNEIDWIFQIDDEEVLKRTGPVTIISLNILRRGWLAVRRLFQQQ